jgi:hypothetical protein
MARAYRHKIINGVIGLLTVATVTIPVFSIANERGTDYEISAGAIWHILTGGVDTITSLAAPLVDVGGSADMAGWILVAVYLLAGPLMLAYFGVRHIVAAISRLYHGNAAISVIIYAAVGWFGLSWWGGRTGIELELLDIADVGFWVGSLALVAGAVVRRIVHD